MSGTRVALLIACSDYADSKFQQLLTPVQDIDALTRVLGDTAIGDFTVDTLLNESSETVKIQIEEFFANRKPDDLLLLYFSCHGILDARDRLHFVAANTKRNLLDATGISAQWVKQQMDQSRSQRIVLLLDCCYSGAFTKGPGRSSDAEEILDQLEGRGRVVITASDKMEYCYESEFTDAVVRGLKTGAADLDGDGQVEVSELYRYVHAQVCRNTSGQTPTMSADGIRGQLYLARNPHAPLPLPAELEQALTSEISWQRRGAVDGLRRRLEGDYPGGQKLTARKALIDLRDHDIDDDVRAAAEKVLNQVSRLPDFTDHRGRGDRGSVKVAAALLGVLLFLTPLLAMDIVTAGENMPCAPRAKAADGILSLGTLLPNTGDTFLYRGLALKAGVQLAIKDVTDAGGIPNIGMTFDEGNRRDEGDPLADTASQSADALLSSGVDVIIGPATSAAALKVIDKVTCAGVILFAPSTTAPVFTTYPDHGLYFRTSPTTDGEGFVLGKLVVADGNSTAVVMSRDDVYGNSLRDATVNTIQKSGGRVLDSFSFNPKATDYHKEIQRIKTKNPDAIVLIGFTESGRILSSMIEKGLGPKSKRVYGATSNMSNTLASQVGSMLSPRSLGVLTGMKGSLHDRGDEAFSKRLREANPGLRDLVYAAEAYDTVVVTALAAAVAGTDGPAVIAREINGVTKDGEKCTTFAACVTLVKAGKNIDYDGASGPLDFADSGEPRSATYAISEIQPDGTVKALKREQVTF